VCLLVTNQHRQDFPFEDDAAREKLMREGQYVLTENEPVFDAADALRFGRDIYITQTNVYISILFVFFSVCFCVYSVF